MNCGRKLGPYDCCSVVCGDCLELMKALPDGCVDALITDPPYGVDFSGKNTKHTRRNDDGYIGGDDAQVGPLAVTLALVKSSRAVVFPGTRQMFLYPRPQDFGCVYCPSGAGIGTWGWTCMHPVLFYGKRPSSALFPSSITSFETSERNGHPCPKPYGWIKWVVSLATIEGETILDPFMGSGTTAVAALKLMRHFLGFEISEDYCRIARERIALVQAQPNLFQKKSKVEQGELSL